MGEMFITEAMKEAGLKVFLDNGVENISARWGKSLAKMVYQSMREVAPPIPLAPDGRPDTPGVPSGA